MSRKPYGCECGWQGSTRKIFIAHLSVAHGLRVWMPSPQDEMRIEQESAQRRDIGERY